MPGSFQILPGRIAVAEIKRKYARKSEFVLAQGTFTHAEAIRLVRTVCVFDTYKAFSLHVYGTEFGDEPPLAVYYRVVPPGPLRLSKVDSVYWETMKKAFLSSFPQHLFNLKKGKSSAMLSHLEMEGDLVRIANAAAQGHNWGVVIFGVGRSTEASDPFDGI